MYNPYMMMMGQGGYPGMGQPQTNPWMLPGAGMPGQAGVGQFGNDTMKAYDSTQMKRGRNGHYGYLEGRGKLRR